MGIRRSKIKNSLKKGTLYVSWREDKWEVINLLTNKALIKNEMGEMFQVHVNELEFKEFIKNK